MAYKSKKAREEEAALVGKNQQTAADIIPSSQPKNKFPTGNNTVNSPTSYTSSISKMIGEFDNTCPSNLQAEQTNRPQVWIGTGNYALNACLSGSIFGGITNRVYAFGGLEGTGKTFLALSICREAQKQGYTPIYIDSENSIDVNFVTRLGVDPSNFIIKRTNTINETSSFISNLVAKLTENKAKTGEASKVLVVLDSLGNLTSDKEKSDTLEDKGTRDMTKQQQIRGMFRVNGSKLTGELGVPFLVLSHVYEVVGSYMPTKELSGGGGLKYNASVILMLSKSKFEDKKAEKQAADDGATKLGITVTVNPTKQRYCKPIKVQINIPFYKRPNPYVGLERYINWDSCGIVRGNFLTEREFDKLSDAEQQRCKAIDDNDPSKGFAFPKETARSLVCKHLGCAVPLDQLFTDKVLPMEVLKKLDEAKIKPSFELPTLYGDSADFDQDIDNYMEKEMDTELDGI